MSELDVTFGVLKQGWADKLGYNHKSLKRRWFVVLPEKIVYSKAPDSTRPQGSIPTKDILECAAATTQELISNKSLQTSVNVFKIKLKSRTFFVVADTRTERDSWVQAILEALKQRQQPRT